MTQIERILKEGIVSEDFLKEETVCGFHVSEQLKKTQAIALDMLLKLDQVCKQNELRYFLSYGTLLGSVRHKGFIPWDDDIDVFMPRKDYERFIKMQDSFEYPYFLQTWETDQGYLGTTTRIRNSETCAFHQLWGASGFNNGLWIDIFPLDNCMIEDREEIFRQIDFYNSYNSAFMKIAGNNVNEKGKKILLSNLGLSPKESLRRINELSMKYMNEETPYVTNYITTGAYSWDRLVWEKSDFEKTVNMNFCGYSFPGPIGYERVLRTTYGNYMVFPPLEKRGYWHHCIEIDADKPYLEYFYKKGIQIDSK